MTDHADTIRRIITDWWDCDISKDAEAQALFAWVAERQQAIDERDAAENNLGVIAATLGCPDGMEVEGVRAVLARCEQAIDALREIADHVPGRYVVQSPDYVQLRARARAALMNLGEQP